jgi:hypothetical protein
MLAKDYVRTRKCKEIRQGMQISLDRVWRDLIRLLSDMEPASRFHLQRRAASAVRHAVDAGRLPRLTGSIPCVDCGQPATAYDHRVYSQKLRVDPVCDRCNTLRGPARRDPHDIIIPQWHRSSMLCQVCTHCWAARSARDSLFCPVCDSSDVVNLTHPT